MTNRLLSLCVRAAAAALWVFLGATQVDGKAPASLLLAKDGAAQVSIVISDQASPEVEKVAGELADYLQKISGAKFKMTKGDGTEGIVVGTIEQFPDPALKKDLEIRNTYDGREAHAIRTEKKRVRLIGATDLGVSNAVFRFLESLGCRWFFPAAEWEIVPSSPTLSANLNESDRPALLSRRIWYGWGFFDRELPRCADEYAAWFRHNRMGGSLQINCGHAWQTIIADNKKIFAAHPEYLALTEGKRQGEQLCVSNPGLRKLAADWALDYFERNPTADMVSMECSDGGGHCECENCKKMGSVSERVFSLANEVAKAVSKSCPGKMVGLYAYNDHSEPPSFKMEPNVCVQLTAGFTRGKYSFDELMDLWPKHCQNMGYYEYLSVYLWDWDMIPGGRGANIGYLRKQIPRYIQCAGTTLDCESGDNWGVHGRGYYVANRLMWNPKVDVDALLADFYQKAFGPAARIMQRYYERLDPGNSPIVSENLLALALRDLQEAAKKNPDVLRRLDHLKQCLHFVRLQWDANHAGDVAKKKELTLAILTHVYRTRYSYMNHWEAFRQHGTCQAAKDFKEPAWAFNEPTPNKPWDVKMPVTPEETEKLFKEDLERFKPESIEEVNFSQDLVPVAMEGGTPAATSQRYQCGAHYALYSVNGEALECTVVTGTIAWYRDRRDASYKLTDPSGKVVATARLPLDGKEHVLNMTVPKAGLYWFDFDDSGAGWGITVAAGKPAVLALQRGGGLMHQGHMQTLYFYVPKGTKEIQYYIQNSTHHIMSAEKEQIRDVEGSGIYVKIPVPAGLDGQVWNARFLALGQLWFFNIPNYLAASPDALLLPREVAKKDGLIR